HQLYFHHRTEAAGLDGSRRLRTEQLDEAVVESFGVCRRRGIDEARSPSLTGIAVEGKLADDEQAAIHVIERAREGGITVDRAEDPQRRKPRAHPRQRGFVIARSETDLQQETI